MLPLPHLTTAMRSKREDDSSAAAYYTLFISNVLHMVRSYH